METVFLCLDLRRKGLDALVAQRLNVCKHQINKSTPNAGAEGGTFFEPLENISRVAGARGIFHVRQALFEVFCARAALLQLAVLFSQALRNALLGVVGFAQVCDNRQQLAARR